MRSAAVAFLTSVIFPVLYRGTSFPYMTVFHNSFAVIEKATKLQEIVFGATNQLFLKSGLPVDVVLRLDSGQPDKPLLATHEPLVRYPTEFRSFTIDGSSEAVDAINARVIRQKLLLLTLDFLEPVHSYFQAQYNDLKVYSSKDLLALLKAKEFKVEENFRSKGDFLRLYGEFLKTKTFDKFLRQNYNYFVRN